MSLIRDDNVTDVDNCLKLPAFICGLMLCVGHSTVTQCRLHCSLVFHFTGACGLTSIFRRL
jgi:hypothetical protein